MKMNASELLMTCRNGRDGVETGFENMTRDEFGGHLFTARTALGMKVA